MKPGRLQNEPLCSACVPRTPLVLRICHQVKIQIHIQNQSIFLDLNMTFHDAFALPKSCPRKATVFEHVCKNQRSPVTANTCLKLVWRPNATNTMVPARPPAVGRVANRFSSAWALPRAPIRLAKRYICSSSAFIALMAMNLRQLAIRQTLHRCSRRASCFPVLRRLSIRLRRGPPNAMYVPFSAFH